MNEVGSSTWPSIPGSSGRPGDVGARRDAVVAAIVFVVVGAIFLASPMRPIGDSHHSMLLAEHLLTRGSFTLYVPVVLFVLWLTVRYRRGLSHRSLAALAGGVVVYALRENVSAVS